MKDSGIVIITLFGAAFITVPFVLIAGTDRIVETYHRYYDPIGLWYFGVYAIGILVNIIKNVAKPEQVTITPSVVSSVIATLPLLKGSALACIVYFIPALSIVAFAIVALATWIINILKDS